MRIRKIDYGKLTNYDKIFEIVFADLGIDRNDVGEEEINKIINAVEKLEESLRVLSQSQYNRRNNINYR